MPTKDIILQEGGVDITEIITKMQGAQNEIISALVQEIFNFPTLQGALGEFNLAASIALHHALGLPRKTTEEIFADHTTTKLALVHGVKGDQIDESVIFLPSVVLKMPPVQVTTDDFLEVLDAALMHVKVIIRERGAELRREAHAFEENYPKNILIKKLALIDTDEEYQKLLDNFIEASKHHLKSNGFNKVEVSFKVPHDIKSDFFTSMKAASTREEQEKVINEVESYVSDHYTRVYFEALKEDHAHTLTGTEEVAADSTGNSTLGMVAAAAPASAAVASPASEEARLGVVGDISHDAPDAE